LNKRDFRREKLINKKRYLVITAVVAVAVLLAILFDTMLANHRPVITSLAAEPEIVLHLGSCQIVCNATDRDGDELSYNWSTSEGRITGEGATVTWTAPRPEDSYNVTVTVTDGHGGKAIDYVTIEVRANEPPTINSLIADADWTTPSGSLQVTCNATDPDGDELSYEWTTTGGDISGTGAAINWTAPQAVGTYNVTVLVTDVLGWSDTKSITLIASNGPPPIIENLVVTAKEPKYLREITPGYEYKVLKTKVYYIEIECIASNTSGELVYDWSCDDGKISWEGSTATWTAPDTSVGVTVTITVLVSDVAGNKVSKNIDFQVQSCTCGF
jgi:hypothetical protein